MTNFSGHGAYEQLVKHVYEDGELRTDRTGTGTYSVFGTRLEYYLSNEFPLLTINRRIYSVDNIDPSVFELTDYNPNPVIKAPVAV